MREDSLTSKVFWRSVAITAVTLVALTALVYSAPIVYTTPHGRFPASMIALMRSRAVIYNPGVTGYYERLFGAPHPLFMSEKEYERWTQRAATDVIYDHSFRIRRFRPNLHRLVNGSQPQGLTTNSFGLLGPERSLHKPAHTRRAALLGDSVSQGWGVDQNKSFASLLENRLNASPPEGAPERFEVINFSVTGYDLTQILDVATEDVPRFEPDVYILSLTELAVFRNWCEHLAWTIRLGIDPKYDSLREIVRQSGASRSDAPLAILGKLAPFRMQAIRSIIDEIKSRAAQHHTPFFIVLMPSPEDGEMSQRRFSGIPELLSSLNVPFIDLRDTFDGILDMESLRINPFDVHPNARGHRMICNNLYAKLRARPDLWKAVAGAGALRPGSVSDSAAF